MIVSGSPSNLAIDAGGTTVSVTSAVPPSPSAFIASSV